jgi:adenosylcobinamide-phosphate synthase
MTTAPIGPFRLLAAYGLDLAVGDPRDMPHPVRLIGAAIAAGERVLRRPGAPESELIRGAVLAASIVAGAWAAARVLLAGSRRLNRRLGDLAEVLLAWTALATRSLLDQSAAVLRSLEQNDLAGARGRLAMIVGRDTDALDETEIIRAVIETVAEGLCDGVVAPLVYLAVGGVPLAFAYKAANTLDSMIGHPEPPYRYFGRAAARLDDAANFLPARMTALAIAAAAFAAREDARGAWLAWRRDGRKHPSPNAGQSEAAMAGALGVRLGGLNYYGGKPSQKPYLGGGRQPDRAGARAALRIASIASLLAFTTAWLWCWRKRMP